MQFSAAFGLAALSLAALTLTACGEAGRPDVIDINPAFIQQALDQDLVTAYQPTTWSQIPDSLKDPQGRWIGTYYGLLTIGANTAIVDMVPTTWKDLADPRYRGQVVLNGDPRQSGTGFAAVVAAALANGGSFTDITPGIDYFARLAQLGNLRVETIRPEAVASGDVPIMLDWAYNRSIPARPDYGWSTCSATQPPSLGSTDSPSRRASRP